MTVDKDRLREVCMIPGFWFQAEVTQGVVLALLDEIERYRAALEWIRERGSTFIHIDTSKCGCGVCCAARARNALADKEPTNG